MRNASSSSSSSVVISEELESRQLLSTAYQVTNLVSNGAEPAPHTDKKLINPWGIAIGPNSVRISNEGSGTSSAFNGNGASAGPNIKIPKASFGAAPTGVVFNDSGAFTVSKGSKSAPARFIYVSIDGGISAWNKDVSDDPILVSNQSSRGAVYTGVARGAVFGKQLIYAANFGSGKIDVFDAKFHRVTSSGAFQDKHLPDEFRAFNVQAINGQLYVNYAEKEEDEPEEAHEPGNGITDVYNFDGSLVRRFVTGGRLNAPWGMTQAPDNFGQFSGDILIGNVGDGHINAYKQGSGKFDGELKASHGKAIEIEELWGIAFGNGQNGFRTDRLYFAAGINDEEDGLFGSIKVATNSSASSARVSHSSVFADAKIGSDLAGIVN